MKKILFRADAAPHIGIGDLMSLINISKYFDDDIEKYFMIKDYKAAVELVKKYQVQNCEIIDSNIDIEKEIECINRFIDEKEIDLIFFEITERKLSDYETVSSQVKKVAVNFDGYIPSNLDLVIDWDVEAYKFFDTVKYPQTKFLLGPEYVILPKEFYSQSVNQRKTNTKKRVMVAMGGADEFDFTSKIVEVIGDAEMDLDITVVVGSGYKNIEKLQNLLNSKFVQPRRNEDQIQNSKLLINITNMLDEYLSCDIGIGAGGLTSSEMVAAKTSPILIATYEHQIARCNYFDEKGWAKYLGFRKFDPQKLINAIVDPIEPTKENIFDTQKIIDEIKKI